ncbi:response regulator transcription factor [Belliella aquatica]|uniref:DNA-binding response regulator n=1 Tax=Belliella aquatica TaxID=1323734 RepID=A0ABQ1MZ22_9BACT|nr:response regulator transcription factor [Belliella aquatica]MCH7404025.1 response regulator transcription factor [Belliella aquatica]GGC49788.1 DNA-binding response regulator [Belliella aquatica]
MRVLLVEDEKQLGIEIKDFLEREGYICNWSQNLKDASEKLAINPYDFVLLDLGLPDGNGLDLINEINAYQEDVSIIILTARSEVNDKIEGLQQGADDYLSKPFSLLELKARMQAIARRKGGWNNNLLEIGAFQMDLNSKLVSHGKVEIPLTNKEFRLLHFLMINKNRVLNRFQLAEHLWGDHLDDDHQSNYIDVHIKNIRKKMGALADVDWLETVRGLGYKIRK